jgi:hypothetical protein
MFEAVVTETTVTVPKAVISELEAKARCLLETVDWRKDDQAVLVAVGVFRREWSSALTVRRIQELAKVLSYYEGDLQPALTRLCKRKVLRSRLNNAFGKERLYEVNY